MAVALRQLNPIHKKRSHKLFKSFLNSQQDTLFHRTAYDYSSADWDDLCDHLRDVPWENIFKLSASAAASEFCECVQVAIGVYLPHRKYQVKPHSSPWFSAVCAAPIVHSIHGSDSHVDSHIDNYIGL